MSEYLADYGLLTWILIGVLAGAIAKVIMPGRDPGGCLVTILLGMAGALWPVSSASSSAGTITAKEPASSRRSSARSCSSSSTA